MKAAGDATPEEVAALQDRAQNLRTEYRTLVLDHEALQRKVRANEDLMRTAFEGALVLTKILAPRRHRRPAGVRGDGQARCTGPRASATQVAEWWSTLTAAEKEAVIATYPDVIGCADGLPADARDQANRISLDGDLDLLAGKDDDGTISPVEARMLANARAAEQRAAHRATPTSTRRPARHPAASCGSTTPVRSTGTAGSPWPSVTWTPPTTWRSGSPASPTTVRTRPS